MCCPTPQWRGESGYNNNNKLTMTTPVYLTRLSAIHSQTDRLVKLINKMIHIIKGIF